MPEVLERIGSYEVTRLIARGGMATVYEGRQPALDRPVALKRLDLRSDDPSLAARFIAEGRLAASFDHPNIVTVYDFFEHEGVPYIAMEYLPRGSLRRWIGHLTPTQVIGVLEGVLAGLAHAESHGVAHRDLKPENVLVTRRGAVKIADFGIAKAYSRAAGELTATSVVLGTPAYMAPEQAEGRPVGASTDLYAVGVMAFEMLSGATPFAAARSPMATLYRHVHEPPRPLADCDPRIARWVARLLEKDPRLRPASAAEAWDELEEIVVDLHGPYWRRDAALEDTGAARRRQREDATLVATTLTLLWRRRPYWALVLIPLAGIGAFVLLGSGGPSERAGRAPPGSAPPAPAATVTAPYDFDGNGRATIAAGLPGHAGGRGAVALPHASRRVTLLRPGAGDRFGAALTSADFNRDGYADLAIGAPARDAGDGPGREGTVTVFYGSSPGLEEPHSVFRGTRVGDGDTGFGAALAAGDLDGDAHGDLVVGAPGAGALQLLFGGRRVLAIAHTRRLRAPAARRKGFGALLALGDVDGDGHPDVVAAGRRGEAFCRGGPRGPSRCEALEGGGGTVALALADVTGDGLADLVEGVRPRGRGRLRGGAVRVRPGTRDGPAATASGLTRSSPGVAGDTRTGDDFGAAVAARDLDGDRFADLVIGVPGADHGRGQVVVVRGARAGAATSGARRYSQGTLGIPGSRWPGHRFGAALALLDAEGDGRPDLVVTAPGGAQAVFVLPGIPGGFTGTGSTRADLADDAAGRSPDVVLGP